MFLKIIIAVFVIGVTGYFFMRPSIANDQDDFNPKVSYKLVKDGAILIDARSPSEFKAGHIKGAINIPHSEIENNHKKISELTQDNKTKAIVVYCQSGRRSQIAKEKLKEIGYIKVVNHGGISSWQEAK